jgi:hypothetical protein
MTPSGAVITHIAKQWEKGLAQIRDAINCGLPFAGTFRNAVWDNLTIADTPSSSDGVSAIFRIKLLHGHPCPSFLLVAHDTTGAARPILPDQERW